MISVKKEKLFDCAATVIMPYKCGQCQNFGDIFLRNVKRHIREGHKTCLFTNPLYKCRNCNFVTYSQYLLMRHNLFGKCKQNNTRNSTVVDESYVLNSILKNTIEKERRFSCYKCHYKATRRDILNEHIIEEHMSGDKQKCHNSFNKRKMHQPVQKEKFFDCTTTNIMPYKCGKCFNFKNYFLGYLKRHVNEGHTPYSLDDPLYNCANCNFVTCSQYMIMRHNFFEKYNLTKNSPDETDILNYIFESTKNKGRILSCNKCDYKTFQRGCLKKHIKEKHKLSDDEKKWLHCEYCDYKTIERSLLKMHIMSKHTSEDEKIWYQCQHCKHKTLCQYRLRKHIKRQHDEKKWFQCEHCSYKTQNSQCFKKHIMVEHTSDSTSKNLWKCKFCDHVASRKINLKKHISCKHTPEEMKKWFYCDQCEYKTLWKSCMKIHVKSKHVPNEEKEKLHCEDCKYVTTSKKNLRSHRARIHKDKT